jgi:hypothetical protein
MDYLRDRGAFLRDRGAFADVPYEAIMADLRRHYPGLIENGKGGGSFHAEVSG